MEYSERWLQWAKTKDGSNGHNPPEPFRFPWEPKPDSGYRADSMTLQEALDFAGWSLEMDEHLKGGA